jgi:drug/metabolite transporter (DMT)-like permease
MRNTEHPHSGYETSLGLISILLWSSSIGVSRGISEKLGAFTAPFVIYLLSALIGLAMQYFRPGSLKALLRLPLDYLLVCGFFFTAYIVLLYTGVGLAKDREAALIVGTLNNLWPALILIYSIPILGKRARWTLIPGSLLAFGGIVFAMLGGKNLGYDAIKQSLLENSFAYLCVLIAPHCWAFYTNFSRRLLPAHPSGGVHCSGIPVFATISMICLGLARCFTHEESHVSPHLMFELSYLVIFPVTLAYVLWERATKRGNLVLLATYSYFLPVVSTVFSSLYLKTPMGVHLWIACAMISIGALICKFSFLETARIPVLVPDENADEDGNGAAPETESTSARM